MFWKRCNTCKKEIGFGAVHYVCSVSTCHRKGTDFVFCSTECWDAHVPTFRHRDAWAEERRAPRTAEAATAAPPPRVESAPPRTSFAPERAAPPPAAPPVRPPAQTAPSSAVEPTPRAVLHDRSRIPREILVVASKLKAYIRARSDLNTSDGVLEVLSDRLRDLCDGAIEHAVAAGRKTVMDRDF